MLDLWQRYKTKVSAQDLDFRKDLYALFPCELSDAVDNLRSKYACTISDVKDAYDLLCEELDRHVDLIKNCAERFSARLTQIQAIYEGIMSEHLSMTRGELAQELNKATAIVDSDSATSEEKKQAEAIIDSVNNTLAIYDRKDKLKTEYNILLAPWMMATTTDEKGNTIQMPTGVPKIAALKLFITSTDAIPMTAELRDKIMQVK